MLGVYDTQFNFSPLAEPSAPTSHELLRRYELLIEQGASDQDNLTSHLRKLKELILAHGIPVRPLFACFHLTTTPDHLIYIPNTSEITLTECVAHFCRRKKN